MIGRGQSSIISKIALVQVKCDQSMMILKLKIKEKENKKFSLVIAYNIGY